MEGVLDLVASYGIGSFLTVALVFGFFPKFAMNVLVLIYPRDQPRRRELLAELETIPHRGRLMWVAEQLATVLFDGIPLRIRTVRARRIQARNSREAPFENPPLDPDARRRYLANLAEVTMGAVVFGSENAAWNGGCKAGSCTHVAYDGAVRGRMSLRDLKRFKGGESKVECNLESAELASRLHKFFAS